MPTPRSPTSDDEYAIHIGDEQITMYRAMYPSLASMAEDRREWTDRRSLPRNESIPGTLPDRVDIGEHSEWLYCPDAVVTDQVLRALTPDRGPSDPIEFDEGSEE